MNLLRDCVAVGRPELQRVVAELPSALLENFVEWFEAGRVQRYPQARFVNAAGECCLVAAMAGVTSAAELTRTPAWKEFPGSALEALSRAFESRRVRAHELYDEALLALSSRRELAAEALIGV